MNSSLTAQAETPILNLRDLDNSAASGIKEKF
jgi:hypothetical protein